MLKKIFYILLIIAVLMAFFAAGLYFWFKSGGMQKYVLENYGKPTIKNDYLYEIIYDGLGFEQEKHILILFLNNTELRPGGGFIGSYATIRTEKGTPHLLKVEGTEILDNNATSYLETVPPKPIKDYLGVDKWFFRDSNWSPDFSVSAIKALELYTAEKGVAGEDIDYVIGITPNVIREILKITGPMSVGGMEFNADNFIEKLQWEVEYGYTKQGLSFSDRKKALQDLTRAVLLNFGRDFLKYNVEFIDLAKEMLKEKQIVIYADDAEIQQKIVEGGWAGEIQNKDTDFILWADANLGSLKTDLMIDRELQYSITPTGSGKYLAKISMKYTHQGGFDWRTSRYRTYVQLFLPLGSELLKTEGVMKIEKSNEPGIVDQGIDNDKKWIGAFIAIEPGKVGELAFEYYLSPKVVKMIEEKNYNLLIQKQIGTEAHKLTLNLDFGTNISAAEPSEEIENFGDNKYKIITDLRLDKVFSVKLK